MQQQCEDSSWGSCYEIPVNEELNAVKLLGLLMKCKESVSDGGTLQKVFPYFPRVTKTNNWWPSRGKNAVFVFTAHRSIPAVLPTLPIRTVCPCIDFCQPHLEKPSYVAVFTWTCCRPFELHQQVPLECPFQNAPSRSSELHLTCLSNCQPRTQAKWLSAHSCNENWRREIWQ